MVANIKVCYWDYMLLLLLLVIFTSFYLKFLVFCYL